jgi:hypothetical protein
MRVSRIKRNQKVPIKKAFKEIPPPKRVVDRFLKLRF